jgi:predicted amidophosphoribosyltransferase
MGAVRRVKATAPQAGLTNAKRRKNMSGAFAPRRPLFTRDLGGSFVLGKDFSLKGARVLLIDDVLTTGATAAACARALKRAGARLVTLAAVARTDRRMGLADFRADFETSRDSTGAATAATAGGLTT